MRLRSSQHLKRLTYHLDRLTASILLLVTTGVLVGTIGLLAGMTVRAYTASTPCSPFDLVDLSCRRLALCVGLLALALWSDWSARDRGLPGESVSPGRVAGLDAHRGAATAVSCRASLGPWVGTGSCAACGRVQAVCCSGLLRSRARSSSMRWPWTVTTMPAPSAPVAMR